MENEDYDTILSKWYFTTFEAKFYKIAQDMMRMDEDEDGDDDGDNVRGWILKEEDEGCGWMMMWMMMMVIMCQDESSRKKMKVVDGSGAGQRAKVAGRQPSLAHIRRIFLPFPQRDSLTFQNCLLIIPFPLSCNLLHVRLLNLDHLHNLQGAFFNCSAQISVLKRKTLFTNEDL